MAVGQSLDDRDETLADLVASFAIGGPIAVLLASLLGYALAAAGLRPVEAMRRRAAEVSLERDGERLPLPAAHDEIRRLGETLNEMLDRLRASYERERRFVADASHELRTPVAVIKTELEGALRAGGHDPQVREALVAAVEECDHLAQLAEDLLVLARSGEGGLPVRPERAAGGRAAGGGARALRRPRARAWPRDQGRGADGLRVEADELRLRQALGNLVDNALRYGDGRHRAARSRAADGGVELEVADSGPGFPPELRRARLRALRPRRLRPHARRHRPGPGDRARDRRGARRPRRASCPGRGAGATVRIRLPECGRSRAALRAISAAGRSLAPARSNRRRGGTE